MRHLFILTDLEGVSGATRFEQVAKTSPSYPAAKRLLTAEVNAVIRGIHKFDDHTQIHIWDGHGWGGINQSELLPCLMYEPKAGVSFLDYFRKHRIESLLFVGQHAMSYTFNGNLCHTMSHTGIEYYSLNGSLIGEFGIWTSMASELNVPTIFLSGDDKACIEASQLVPNIETVSVKIGTGWESANSLSYDEVHKNQYARVQIALDRADKHEIRPVHVSHPLTLEICNKSWQKIAHISKYGRRTGMKSIAYTTDRMEDLIRHHIL